MGLTITTMRLNFIIYYENHGLLIYKMSIRNSLTNKNNSRPVSAKRSLPPRKSTSTSRSRTKLSRANSNENASPYVSGRPSTASKARPLGNYNHRRTASTATEEPK